MTIPPATVTVQVEIAVFRLGHGAWVAEVDGTFLHVCDPTKKKAVQRVKELYESAIQGWN